MTSQKRNKIILSIIILGAGIIILGVFLYRNNSTMNLKQLSIQCESPLRKDSIFMQNICLIAGHQIMQLTNDNDLNTKIYPSSRFIISLDLDKILNLYKTFHNISENNIANASKKSFCFVFYPVPSSSQAHAQSFDRVTQFYNQFKITPVVQNLHFLTDQSLPNIICTQPNNSTQFVSFIVTLPGNKTFMSLLFNPAYKTLIESNLLDIKQYGIKVLLANSEFVQEMNSSSANFRKSLEKNYSSMIPITVIKHNINFAY